MTTKVSRATESTFTTKVTIETSDGSDCSYNGLMFPIKVKKDPSIQEIILKSFSVRGNMGPITIWVSRGRTPPKREEYKKNKDDSDSDSDSDSEEEDDDDESSRKHLNWSRIYKKTHDPSPDELCDLILREPLYLVPGEICGFYIHSSATGDGALKYNEKKKKVAYDDWNVSVYSGKAHLSKTPFGSRQGNNDGEWCCDRDFVGRIGYEVTHRLWNPKTPKVFGEKFLNDLVWVLFKCQRRSESPMSLLPDECIFRILNLCRCDWMDVVAPTVAAADANGEGAMSSSSSSSSAKRANPDSPSSRTNAKRGKK